MTSQTLNVHGTELHVEDTGEAELPPVLCLHSLFLDGRMFEGLVAAAAGRYRMVRPDFRGQGRSAAGSEDLIDMDTCAADTEALIEQLASGSVHLVVQSMGGDVGFRLAARRPDLVRSMVVLGSSACGEPADQLEAFRGWVEDVRAGGFQGATLETTMEIMFGETTRKNPAQNEMLHLWRSRIAALRPTLVPAMSGVIERGSVVELLPQVEMPVLVVSGTEDLPRPPAWADEVVAGLPNVELYRLEGIGHSPILESPAAVEARILEFLDAQLADV